MVFCGETIEHLEDPKWLFKDAYRVLKDKGRLIVTTPETDRIQSPEHIWEFNHDDVENLFMNSGFKKVEFEYLPRLEHLVVIYAVGYK